PVIFRQAPLPRVVLTSAPNTPLARSALPRERFRSLARPGRRDMSPITESLGGIADAAPKPHAIGAKEAAPRKRIGRRGATIMTGLTLCFNGGADEPKERRAHRSRD